MQIMQSMPGHFKLWIVPSNVSKQRYSYWGETCSMGQKKTGGQQQTRGARYYLYLCVSVATCR